MGPPNNQITPKSTIFYLLHSLEHTITFLMPHTPLVTKKKLTPRISSPELFAGLPGFKPRFCLLLYNFFGPDSMTFYDHVMTF